MREDEKRPFSPSKLEHDGVDDESSHLLHARTGDGRKGRSSGTRSVANAKDEKARKYVIAGRSARSYILRGQPLTCHRLSLQARADHNDQISEQTQTE